MVFWNCFVIYTCEGILKQQRDSYLKFLPRKEYINFLQHMCTQMKCSVHLGRCFKKVHPSLSTNRSAVHFGTKTEIAGVGAGAGEWILSVNVPGTINLGVEWEGMPDNGTPATMKPLNVAPWIRRPVTNSVSSERGPLTAAFRVPNISPISSLSSRTLPAYQLRICRS